MDFPVYKLRISDEDNDELQVKYIALVDSPAILTQWQAFKNMERFAVDKERQIVTGPLMIANMPIYRKSAEMGEFYIVFEKEEIEKIVHRFFRKGFQGNFNIMHEEGKKVEGVYLFESFIIDETRGVVAPKAFEGLSQGSWMGSAKIDNQEVWDAFIKTGQLKGFSIEGLFNYEFYNEADEKVLDEIAEIVGAKEIGQN